jgi:hypothetical protein
MAFNLLSAQGLLSEDEEYLFAVIYLLDGPVVGDKMNLAWRKIEILSSQYTRRLNILSEIKKLPIIPDKIFNDPNSARNKAIISMFSKNFPELLNYYGESCLKYIEHKTDSGSNISSGFQCNEFLKNASLLKKTEKINWISDSIDTQYSSLKK